MASMAAARFPHIKTHTFRNRLFRILWKRPSPKDEGQCDYHGRSMHIYTGNDAEELLGTTIHESIHACCFDLENSVVDEIETDLMRLLRRMGIKVTFEPKP